MNFVAEPYAALVDQLLTGLTGGEARETHRFFPVNDGYGLTRDFAEIRGETIKVVGQHEQRFTAFVPGRDWLFGGDGKVRFASLAGDPGTPAEGALWPDEGSDFHVSYYHRDSTQSPLTDRNVGSLNRTLAEAYSRELAVLYKQLEKVYRSGFLDTAEGRSLDQVVALLGVARKSGEFAAGVVRFFRSAVAGADVFIPAGTRVSTAINPPVSFLTTATRRLRRGQLSVEAPVRAEIRGAQGVVAAAAIVTINQAILGITGVTNDAPSVFGGASESDEELRARARTVLERVGRATPGAIVNAVAANSGLKENEIRLSESLQARPGVIEVFVAREPDAELARQVDDAILANRPAGVRAEHNLEVALRPEEDAEVGDEDNAVSGDTVVPGSGSDFRVPLRIRVLVYPLDARITVGDQERLRSGILTDLGTYFETLPIGAPVIYNRLVARLMALAEIRDLELDVSPAPVEPPAGRRNLRLSDGALAVIADPTTDIIIEFAGSPVLFDFQVAITLAAGTTLADAEIAIREKLGLLMASSPQLVDAASLLAALQPDPGFTTAAGDLAWTAEYEQAGLVLGGQTEPVEIGPRERPVLRGLTVSEK